MRDWRRHRAARRNLWFCAIGVGDFRRAALVEGPYVMAAEHDRFGPPEAYGQPPRTGRHVFDLLAAIFAIVISVVSLVVAFRGERTQRGLLAANSWPFVQLSEDQTSQYAKLDVENAGVGPAKIMTFEVSYNGKPVDSAIDLLRKCCGFPAVAPHAGFEYGAVFNNVLRPGEHIIALSVTKDEPSLPVYNQFGHEMAHMSFSICYCSVLEECWTSNLRDLTQIPKESCPVAQHPFVNSSGP